MAIERSVDEILRPYAAMYPIEESSADMTEEQMLVLRPMLTRMFGPPIDTEKN